MDPADDLMPAACSDAAVRVVDLRTSDRSGLIATGCSAPILCWRLESDRPDVRQFGYEIEVASDPRFSRILSGSGFIPDGRVAGAAWPGPALSSREICWWRVRVRTDQGITGWSDPSRIEAALFDQADWVARPISPAANVGLAEPGPVPLLRRAFAVDQPIVRARFYVTALGVFEATLNGRRIGDALLEPGWTVYPQRLHYAVHDVTDLLRDGENVIAASIGDGWWRGNLTWMDKRAVYGDTTALLAQLELHLADGSIRTIATDHSWRGTTGAVRSADLYDGSSIDLALDPEGWREPGFDDSGWDGVTVLPMPARLEARSAPSVRIVDRWTIEPEPTSRGTLMIDTGQNLTGFLRIRARGKAGARLRVRHAEVLAPDGSLYTELLRSAKATDDYRLAGTAPVTLEPAFTFHGFRHAEIVCDPDVAVEEVEVMVLSSDLPRIGMFECSDDRINRLFSNVWWSQRGNLLSIPTDCPQRDERLGWTGDIQVFASTACANADAEAFLGSWLRDLAAEQRGDGCVPSTVPNVIQDHPFEYGAAGWGDAATLVPWAIYQAYGSDAVLRAQFGSMRGWVDWCASRLGPDGTWRNDFQLGDWLDPAAPPEEPGKSPTDADFIATAYLSYSAGIVAKAAAVLGKDAEAERYGSLSRNVAAAAWQRWRDHAPTTQAGCAIAIMLEVAPEAERPGIAAALAALVRRSEGRIATGFLGTPLVLPALSSQGEIEAAYRLLLNEECPGWLYQLRQGATTMWERWDAIRPDGTVHRGEVTSDAEAGSMMSFNHYAYGAVVAWLYRAVAGLAPDPSDPGYRTILFAPRPGGGLDWARAAMETPYGRASIRWERRDGRVIHVAIEIPSGATGRFSPPPGSWRVGGADGEQAGELTLGSGTWELELRTDS